MKRTVNRTHTRGNPEWMPAYKKDAILMAARVPRPLAEAIAASGLSKTDAIIRALDAYFSAKK